MVLCQLEINDLGKMPYEPALELQRKIQQGVIERRGGSNPSPFHLLLVEHDPPVITVRKRPGSKKHLLASTEQLQNANVQLCQTDRGGDITYHGPGQLVGYLICDLNALSLRLHGYMRFLETTIFEVLDTFGIEGHRDDCGTGVWIGDAKICAMGVRISRWVSMHGFALNVSPIMKHYDYIVPCGLAGRSVTSMKQVLQEKCPSMETVKQVVSKTFKESIANQAQVQTEPRP